MGEKKRVSLNEVLADFRSGLDDGQLMAKYGLSAKQLEWSTGGSWNPEG